MLLEFFTNRDYETLRTTIFVDDDASIEVITKNIKVVLEQRRYGCRFITINLLNGNESRKASFEFKAEYAAEDIKKTMDKALCSEVIPYFETVEPFLMCEDLIGWHFDNAFTIENGRYREWIITFSKDGKKRQYYTNCYLTDASYNFTLDDKQYSYKNGSSSNKKFDGNLFDVSLKLKGAITAINYGSYNFNITTEHGEIGFEQRSKERVLFMTLKDVSEDCPFDISERSYSANSISDEEARSEANYNTRSLTWSFMGKSPFDKYLEENEFKSGFAIIDERNGEKAFELWPGKRVPYNDLDSNDDIHLDNINRILNLINKNKDWDFISKQYGIYDDFAKYDEMTGA